MLDKTILAHLKDVEVLEIAMIKNVDSLIESINIDRLMLDPEKELLSVAESFKNIIEEQYSIPAMEEGLKLAEEVKKDIKNKIKVNDSADVTLNKEEFNDKVSSDTKED